MAIGGALDAGRRATGSAAVLTNHAAAIESARDMKIEAAQLNNTNGGVTWTMEPGQSTHVVEYSIPGSATRYDASQVFFGSGGYSPEIGWPSFEGTSAASPMSQGDNPNIDLIVPSPDYPLERYRAYYERSPAFSRDIVYKTSVGTGDNTIYEPRTARGAWYARTDPIWATFGVAPPAADLPETHPGRRDPDISVGQEGIPYLIQTESGSISEIAYFEHPVTQAEYDEWQAFRATHGQLDEATKKFAVAIIGNRYDANSRIHSIWDAYDLNVSTTTPVLQSSAPGQIIAGGKMDLTVASGTNEMSQILAGGALSVSGGAIVNVAKEVDATRQTHGSAIHSYVAQHSFADDERRYDVRGYDLVEPSTVTLAGARQEGKQGVAPGRPIEALSTGQASASAQGGAAVHTGTRVNPIVQVPSAVTAGDAAPGQSAQGGAQAGQSLDGASLVDAASGQNADANSRAGAAPGLVVRTSTPNTGLPSASLFDLNPGGRYLIETDPRFANHRNWLSSDYLLSNLGLDPGTTQKRLGDGFYEQRLIREQVAHLTGYRYLGGYASDEAQYTALMNAGAAFARQYSLRPGIALSAAQMAQLSSDIVWLVEQSVQLPGGSVQKVLVPQVYVRLKPGDIDGSGTLLSGSSVHMQLTGDMLNGGTIAGRNALGISAGNIHSLGGRITGGSSVDLLARKDINNIGGRIEAGDRLTAVAGGDIRVQSTTRSATNSATGVDLGSTYVERVAGLYVTKPGGQLIAAADGDITLKGADVRSEGAASLQAGRDLNLETVGTASRESIQWSTGNNRNSTQTREVGSVIKATGDIALNAGNDVNARAATVSSAQGDLEVTASRDVNVMAGQATESFDGQVHRSSSGLLGSSSSTERTQSSQTHAQGSSFGGATVTLDAGRDSTVRGSNVVSDKGTELWAGRDVNIEAAIESYSKEVYKEKSSSGLFGGGSGLTLGKQKETHARDSEGTRAAASTVGAITGDVYVTAGNRYRQVGSDVIAPTGDIDILASDVQITEARETHSSEDKHSFSQGGISLGIKAPMLDALAGAVGTTRAMQDADDDRMRALGAASLAMSGYSTYQSVAQAAASANPNDAGAAGMGMQLSIGSSSSQSTHRQQSDTAAGSRVDAGGSVRITATRAGQDSNLLIRGSEVKAGENVDLSADNRVNIEAADNTQSQSSTHSASHASVGIGMSMGQTTGFTVDVAYGQGHGSDNGTDTAHTVSQITAGNNVSITSGGDSTIRGSVVSGNRVSADVGGNLRIETVQDTSTYQSQDSGSGFDASICVYMCSGGSASAGGHSFQGQGNYASATEQSGIRVGDGGFNVQVDGNTALVGGVISSTDKAVNGGRNSFNTGSLSLSDVHNHDSFTGSGYSVNVSTSAGGNSAGVGSVDVKQQSTTQSGISGIAGNTGVRTGTDTTNAIKRTDVDKAMGQVSAQVSITSTATGITIQMGPAVVEQILKLVDQILPVRAGAGQQGLDLLKKTPDERRAHVRSEFDDLLKTPNLTNEQRDALQQALQMYEKAESARQNSYDRSPTEGATGTQSVQFVIPFLPGAGASGAVGGAAAGNGGAGNAAQGGHDPQTDTYSPGTPAIPIPSPDSFGGLPPAVALIYAVFYGVVTGTQSTASGGNGDNAGSGPTGGNGADTYGTPPNGASPPPEGENDDRAKADGSRTVQSGGRTLSNHSAKELNDASGQSLNRRDWGRALEELKKENGLRGDVHGTLKADGSWYDSAGIYRGNLNDYVK